MQTDESLDRFRDYLSDQGLKFTKQRRAIAEAFYGSGDHVSLNDLLALARELHPSVGYATVYRTMKLMAASGLAAEHRFGDGYVVYEPTDGDHHDHLICVRCGRITEFEDVEIEALQDAVALRFGFTVQSHRHEIYGLCNQADCEERAT